METLYISSQVINKQVFAVISTLIGFQKGKYMLVTEQKTIWLHELHLLLSKLIEEVISMQQQTHLGCQTKSQVKDVWSEKNQPDDITCSRSLPYFKRFDFSSQITVYGLLWNAFYLVVNSFWYIREYINFAFNWRPLWIYVKFARFFR